MDVNKEPIYVAFELNGQAVQGWVPANRTLLEVLRTCFGVTEVKYGCGEGVCGTCTVLLEDEPVNACLMFAGQVSGQAVVTLSGLVSDGELHPLQKCFLAAGASQCGFCTPGMVLTALSYVNQGGSANREAIREALAGNLCRCTGYMRIIDAVERYMTHTREERDMSGSPLDGGGIVIGEQETSGRRK